MKGIAACASGWMLLVLWVPPGAWAEPRSREVVASVKFRFASRDECESGLTGGIRRVGGAFQAFEAEGRKIGPKEFCARRFQGPGADSRVHDTCFVTIPGREDVPGQGAVATRIGRGECARWCGKRNVFSIDGATCEWQAANGSREKLQR